MDLTETTDDLCCPLCEYSLRGLVEPRCPECGFAFSWAELLAADRDRHPWLFEHAERRRLRSLRTTAVRNLRPWRFWRDVTPANPVNGRRLVGYWAVTGLVAAALLLAPLPHGLWQAWDRPPRFMFNLLTGTYGPPSADDWLAGQGLRTWDAVRSIGLFTPAVIGPPLLVLAWPWLSVAALLVFRLSMRQAKISPGHVVRVAVYGCDFGYLVAAAVGVAVPVELYPRGWRRAPDGVSLAYLALFCGGVATVRLSVAYARYLRFHRPVLTVLASQVMVVLFVWTCLGLTADLGNLFR